MSIALSLHRHGSRTASRAWILAATVAALWAASTDAGEWLRGDLHAHSLYSDGDSSVGDVLAAVEAAGLDFFALTDHDVSVGGVPAHWYDPAYASDSTILLFGAEWTTSLGHANVWAAEPFDYSALWAANRSLDAEAAVAAAHDQAALFSINHPARIKWKLALADGVDCVEVWNGPMVVNNNLRATQVFWDDALRAGRRITGVGGSDTHQLHGWQTPFTGHGEPTTWVYADEATAAGVLEAIAAGRVTISRAPDAPRVELEADGDGDGVYETLMGESLAAGGQTVQFDIRLVGNGSGTSRQVAIPAPLLRRLERGRLRFWDLLWFGAKINRLSRSGEVRLLTVIKDGSMLRAWLITSGTELVTFSDPPAADSAGYYRVELYGDTNLRGLVGLASGNRLALTNPIYFNH